MTNTGGHRVSALTSAPIGLQATTGISAFR